MRAGGSTHGVVAVIAEVCWVGLANAYELLLPGLFEPLRDPPQLARGSAEPLGAGVSNVCNCSNDSCMSQVDIWHLATER